ncbi:HU family DNA-binding protein [Vibrio sp. Vb5031]|uniref:HU family DNA-binding protein n=1 Tax=Vibrio TaxID=662 RepID=UPI002160D4C6|nr:MULTISPECIES: HU family DNA-binding protein [Vibrio]HAV1574481.1 HU family DNA-binding protein [Vibrio parahaemolyticus]EGQ9764581.1 HU family DNA-binding protein [Vibrio alginolyticus]ELA6641032.1 HU family DNA-binding protein [Vibrio alginolyticus]ELB2863698.1 HU family DNA-binding protein [Vibrio alginolyticus]MCR9544980.1 HU family DNA-binding protein [Vibrio antiquarius]
MKSNTTIAHSEMITRVSEKCDLSEQEVKKLLDIMMNEIAAGSVAGGTMFRGFGRFDTMIITKSVFNPKTLENVGERTFASLKFSPFRDGVVVHE